MAANNNSRSLAVTGTNLNTPLVKDLSTATNLYAQEIKESPLVTGVGSVISFIGNTISISVETLFKAISGVVDFSLGLVSGVKDMILGFIGALVGRDLGGPSKLSLNEKNNLNKQKQSKCNLADLNFGFDGFNASILGYSIAALLAMLLCKGIELVFSLLGSIIDLGIATVDIVAGAVSDVFKNVVGGNTIGIVNDLAGTNFGNKISSNINNSEAMILGAVKKNTAPLTGSATENYNKLNGSLNKLTPNWLSNGKEFTLGKIQGNTNISSLASKSLGSKAAQPLLGSTNYSNKVLSSKEKISLFSKF